MTKNVFFVRVLSPARQLFAITAHNFHNCMSFMQLRMSVHMIQSFLRDML